jgi:hypothetical protein
MAGDPTREGWWPTYSSLHPAEAAQLQANYQRDNIANAIMQQPTQALSGGTVQYSTPTAPTGVAAQADNSDIPASLLARMSPTDIALFRRASSGQSIPTGVSGPYGGGAMGQTQVPSGYNAFSGAGLPPTNIGGGGLTDPGIGSTFAGGGSVGGGSSAPSTGRGTIGVPPSQGGQYGGDPYSYPNAGGLPTGNPYMFGYGYQPGVEPTPMQGNYGSDPVPYLPQVLPGSS